MPTSKQRREAERRRLQRQLERRAQREARRRRTAVIASIVGTLIVVGIVIVFVVATGNDSKTPAAASTDATPTASATSSPASAASYPCSWTKDATAAKSAKPPATTTPPKTGTVNVSVTTTRGQMTFALNRAAAPCTVESFVSLARQHYFDTTPCHRLTTRGIYVLQCGDPTGVGTGGPGYTIPDEASGSETYPAGTVAMARSSSPHTGGSQFFIVYKDSPNLVQGLGRLQYTVFGKVINGLSVVEAVAAKGSNPVNDGRPNLSITLSKLAVS